MQFGVLRENIDLEFWVNFGQKTEHESILGYGIDHARKRNHGSQQTEVQWIVFNYWKWNDKTIKCRMHTLQLVQKGTQYWLSWQQYPSRSAQKRTLTVCWDPVTQKDIKKRPQGDRIKFNHLKVVRPHKCDHSRNAKISKEDDQKRQIDTEGDGFLGILSFFPW